jgi:hypothetical protein
MKLREQKSIREYSNTNIMNMRLILSKEYDRPEEYKRNMI